MNQRSLSSVRLCVAAILAAAAGLCPRPSHAGPTGGEVVSGQGDISTNGSTTTVNQQSQNLSLNWQQFNIASNETVNFVQPSSSAIALNRVTGNEASQIFGHLNANGRVFLVNPNGVLFAPSAQVDVGGLVASTLNLSDSDFLAGRYRFSSSEDAPASVINRGSITAASGGSIALLGGRVSNEGTLRADLGTVALAAGRGVTLDFSGTRLMSVQVNESALGALAGNHQLIQADGGMVVMTAAARDALLDTVVNNTGVIQARTLQNKGGVIKLLGSFDGGTVVADGTLDASAPNGGNGGEIDTSGAHVKISDSLHVTTLASQGNTGNWLIDPPDYIIAASGGDITGAQLGSNLENTNVTIASSQGTVSPNGGGDITVSDNITWSAPTTLTLNAVGNVNINAAIINTVGPGSGVTLRADSGSTCVANGAACSTVTFNGFGVIGAQFINIYYNPTGSNTLAGASGVGPSYATPTDFSPLVGGAAVNAVMLVNDVNQLQAMNTNLVGQYLLGRDIDATTTSGWNANAGFTPIGAIGGWFVGGLDGAGHTVTGLHIDRPALTSGTGLFGALGYGAVVKNVGLVGGYVSGQSYVGGIAGNSDGAKVSNVWATGGFEVRWSGTPSATVGNVGVLVGEGAYAFDSTINAHYNVDDVTVNGARELMIGGLFDDQFQDWVSHGRSLDINDYQYSFFYDAASSSYLIHDVQGLRNLLGFANNASYRFALAEDLDLSAAPGLYIPGFSAEQFDGAGHSISNLWINQPNSVSIGLFGEVGPTSTIRNVTLRDADVSGYFNVGGIAGNARGMILNSSVTGSVQGDSNVGGIVGLNRNALQYSWSTANVSGVSSVGGLAGSNSTYAAIIGSHASGQVVATGLYAGGLVGFNSGSLAQVYASTQVNGGSGHSYGGLLGFNEGTVTEAYAVGAVSGASSVGGLVGTNRGTISDTWSSGHVASGMTSGGLVGVGFGPGTGTVSDSYWDTQTSGQATSPEGGTGLTTAQMMDSSNLSGFDLATDWFLVEGNTRPFLRSEGRTLISNAHELQMMIGINGHYTLANDIDLSVLQDPSEMWNTGTGFVPVGTPSYPFSGELNGNHYTISNLFIDRPNTEGVGLFGGLAHGSVYDLALTGAFVRGGSRVGTFAGVNDGMLDDVVAFGSTVTSLGDYAGGLAGLNVGNIQNSLAAVTVTGARFAGGLAGMDSGQIFNSHYNFDDVLINGAHRLSAGALFDGQYQDWVTDFGLDIADYSSFRFDPATSAYVITTVQGLKDLLGFADQDSLSFRLGADIDLANDPGFYVPSFGASLFDGAGHTISNLSISDPTAAQVGMFGRIGGLSRVSGLRLEAASVIGGRAVGGLAGQNDGEVDDVHVSGSVSGTDYVGGLVGDNRSYLYQVSSSADVSGETLVGGLVGMNESEIDNAYATGNVSGDNGLGGLVGWNLGLLKNAYATGTVSGSAQVGGLAGANFWRIANTYSTGAVTAASGVSAGGLVGYNVGLVGASFWDTEASGQADMHDGRGTGVTSAGMKQASTFSGWGTNISAAGGSSATWRIYEGNTTPLLRSFMTNASVTVNDSSVAYNGTAQNAAVSFDAGSADAGLIFTAATAYRNAGRYANQGSRLYSNQDGYDISYTDGVLDITRANITVSSRDVTKTYDGTTSASGVAVVTSGALLGGDTISGVTVAYTDKNAGTNKVVTTSGVTIDDGNGGSNYNVVYADNTTSTIERKALTYTVASQNKVYDGTTLATVTLSGLTGLVGDETLILSGTGVFNSKDVATADRVIVTGATLGDGANGGLASNYSIAAGNSVAANITPANLAITAGSASRRAGAANPAFDLSYAGFAAGEGTASLTTLPNASTSANASSPAGSYTINVSGASNPNYSFTYVPGTLTVIGNSLEVPSGTMAYLGDLLREDMSDGSPATYAVVADGLLNVEGAGIRLPVGVR